MGTSTSEHTGSVRRVDHVAIEVADFDERIELLTGALGMRVQRLGTLFSDPSRRVAMVGDGAGFKLELIEADVRSPVAGDHLAHVAFLTDDVDAGWQALVAAGLESTAPPRDFEPALSRTATCAHPGGTAIQLVNYAEASLDR